MCCGPYDFDYPTYGGIHQRANPSQGRVGSVFSDPLYVATGPSADSNLKEHAEPRRPLDQTEDDDDFDRADEDLDDDLEGLDDLDEIDDKKLDQEIDDLDRELKELDLENDMDDDLESIEPLEDVNNRLPETGNAALQRWRRRVALPKRKLQRR